MPNRVLAAIVLCLGLAVRTGAGEIVERDGVMWMDDEFIVAFAEDYTPADVESLLVFTGCDEVVRVGRYYRLLRASTPFDEAAMADSVGALGAWRVELAAVNHVQIDSLSTQAKTQPQVPEELQPPAGLVNDPYWPEQWGMGQSLLNVERLWYATHGDAATTTVVVIDSGLDTSHPDFAGHPSLQAMSFVEDGSVDDEDDHGTAMAGIIGAQHNMVGIAGVAPEAGLISMKILHRDGDDIHITDKSFLAAIDSLAVLATSNPVRNYVALRSGRFYDEFENTAVFHRAFERLLTHHNVLFIAASGNGGFKEIGGYIPYSDYPASFSGDDYFAYSQAVDDIVVAVSSVGFRNVEESCSYYIHPVKDLSWAAKDTCQLVVDVCGPGGDGLSMLPVLVPGRYDYASGTSVAAAHIAGMAALAWSIEPTISAEELKRRLRGAGRGYYGCTDGGLPRDYQFIRPFLRHMTRGWMVGYEEYCPLAGLPYEEPIWPPESWKTTQQGVDYDTYCSRVLGSGTPDGGLLVLEATDQTHQAFAETIDTYVEVTGVTLLRTYGDLVIAAGGELVLSPPAGVSTIVIAFPDTDHRGGGADPDAAEFIIAPGGRFTPHADVILGVNRLDAAPGTSSWSGLVVADGAYWGDAAHRHDLILRDTAEGVTIGDGAMYVARLTVDSEDTGVDVNGTLVASSLEVTARNRGLRIGDTAAVTLDGGEGSNLAALVPGIGAGIEAAGGVELTATAQIELTGWYCGLYVSAGADLALAAPVQCLGLPWGACLAAGAGLDLTAGGFWSEGAGAGYGVYANGADLLRVSAAATLSCNGHDYGVHVSGCSVVDLDGTLVARDNLLHGFYFDDCPAVTIAPGVSGDLSDNALDGLLLYEVGSATVSNLLLGGNTVGLGVHGGTAAIVRGCDLFGNHTGVAVDGVSALNMGVVGATNDPGGNRFRDNTSLDALSLNTATMQEADGNLWWPRHGTDYACPPAADRLDGWFSTDCEGQ
jgi:hypothetical protein